MGPLHEQIHVGDQAGHDEEHVNPGEQEHQQESEQGPAGQPVRGFPGGVMAVMESRFNFIEHDFFPYVGHLT